MANEIIQAGRAIQVVPSDTISIVNPGTKVISSTTTATTADKLTDSAGLFTTTNLVKIGDTIINTTDGTTATVTAVDSATALSISSNIMTTTETYKIFSSATLGSCLYIGTAGNLSVETGGDTVLFTGVIGGTFLPVHCTRVNDTLTTASNIVALT